ncbi:hypothetical protein [Chromohalobacter canadensis]|uniref:hypothetical protein n=1 Tax=Chromohalobacter canadensis TaxID=141389 RepID=UPI002410B5DE|nr:hypothetical protein [Chromohalobacter canadensis]
MEELAKILSNIDELETWKNHVQGYSKSGVASAYKMAQPLWVQRMVSAQKLFLHPDIVDQLKAQNWQPNDVQKKMIWASILGSDESPESKKRMYRVKDSLIKKYGEEWWEDVYARIKPVYAAKERVKKIYSGPAVSAFINNTFIGSEAASEERSRALKMIPKS